MPAVAAEPKANVSSLENVEIGICDTPYEISKQFFIKMWINEAVKVKVMLDSGSAGNFISPDAVQRCGLNTQPRETPLSVTHVQGGKVGLVTEQVRCRVRQGNHSEFITFNVVPLGKHAIIIGMPWLQIHNPNMDWEKSKLSFNSDYCRANCIRNRGQEDEGDLEIMEISVVSEEEKGAIPSEYHDLLEVFDIDKARSLPPTRGEFDFKIDFKEGAEWPRPAKPYRLTPAQMEEAKTQIQELKNSGMISKSQSPFVAPLFFVGKKDRGQRMCIDYRKLNDITIRDAYPLPNMESLLELA